MQPRICAMVLLLCAFLHFRGNAEKMLIHKHDGTVDTVDIQNGARVVFSKTGGGAVSVTGKELYPSIKTASVRFIQSRRLFEVDVVSAGQIQVQAYNLTGRLIFSARQTVSAPGRYNIPLSDVSIAKGTYLVRVDASGKIFNKMIYLIH
ncbi:MAG: T9SS type A sorting domain-containing protein [Fibrobacter sp.]|jgi:hypothetical protein|nr:T9SS type A sorting domain-containing protein [Fibrobacter sp.]